MRWPFDGDHKYIVLVPTIQIPVVRGHLGQNATGECSLCRRYSNVTFGASYISSLNGVPAYGNRFETRVGMAPGIMVDDRVAELMGSDRLLRSAFSLDRFDTPPYEAIEVGERHALIWVDDSWARFDRLGPTTLKTGSAY
jgi:hypothetical protein